MNAARKLVPLFFLLMTSVAATPPADRYQLENIYHDDFRKTPKILFNVDYQFHGFQGGDLVQEYLKSAAPVFRVKTDELVLQETQSSLLGRHYRYRQMLGGYEVLGGEVVVSLNQEDQSIFRVFNSAFPVSNSARQAAFASKTHISEERAYDIAWNDLKVHGRVLENPSARKVFLAEEGGFRMVYIVRLAVEKPFGYWQHLIDAETGEIVRREDRRLTRKLEKPVDIASYQGTVWNRREQFDRYRSLESKKLSTKLEAASGGGLVFDPDPRTTLGTTALKDKSPAAAFEAAYFQRELKDISFDGANYSLIGPWVQLKDFESPTMAPSQTANGQWSAKRGDVAFNDVMTYYHLDKNQRYMQSLGFVGDKAIQGVSIEVDANGVSGQDNSHYIPSSNRMAFGHGCVDDNEDADVILHEYGHAINYSINRNWSGGDTGAMGEGFGDYWAGSYSLSTENGSFLKNYVFSWDGHGDGDECWPGRRMDRLDVSYNHSRTYPPHSQIENGAQSDELWSTPLFQALLTLVDRGYPRENVDRIVLESQFGLGSGLKMRDLANAVVQTANRLHPEGPYAQVFLEKFVHHGIIELPKASLSLAGIELSGTGANGRADPGETVSLKVAVNNKGTHGAEGITGVLSAVSEHIAIVQGRAAFGSAGMGGTAANEQGLVFKLGENFECGTPAKFNLNLSFDGGASREAVLPISFGTGVARSSQAMADVGAGLDIPDNEPAGVSHSLRLNSAETVKSLKVKLKVQHTFIGDLKIALIAPSGKTVVLHSRSGGSAKDIDGIYPDTLTPAESLGGFVGEAIGGEWKLQASDTASRDTGKLLGWGLEIVSGYDCE